MTRDSTKRAFSARGHQFAKTNAGSGHAAVEILSTQHSDGHCEMNVKRCITWSRFSFLQHGIRVSNARSGSDRSCFAEFIDECGIVPAEVNGRWSDTLGIVVGADEGGAGVDVGVDNSVRVRHRYRSRLNTAKT